MTQGSNWLVNNYLLVIAIGIVPLKLAVAIQVKPKTEEAVGAGHGDGDGGQSVGPVLFGFGTTASVDSLIVEWPSGLVTTQTGVSTNDTLTLSEPTPLFARTGEASSTLNSRAPSWADYDGDGDLDLHVANYGQVDSLYRNDAGVMTPVGVTTMTTASSYSFGGSWGDYDGDGDPDLSVGYQWVQPFVAQRWWGCVC